MKLRAKVIAFLVGVAFLAQSALGKTMSEADENKDCVILLHGMGRTAWSMKRLEWSLRKQDYRVINISYPSTRLSIEAAAEQLEETLKTRAPGTGKVHFVTHSLGGIVLRQCQANRTIPNLGRVVMLAPPNQGSELADKLRGNCFYRGSTGPSGQQLGTGEDSVPRRLPAVDFELGVIAGDRSLNPLFSSWIPGPDDGKVSVESTKLAGMKDFLVVHSSHTWMAWSKEVTGAVSRFLKSGRFEQQTHKTPAA